MSNILDFGELTGKTVDPDKLLENAKGSLEEILILGWDEDGNLLMGGNMTLEGANLLIDQAKNYLINPNADS